MLQPTSVPTVTSVFYCGRQYGLQQSLSILTVANQRFQCCITDSDHVIATAALKTQTMKTIEAGHSIECITHTGHSIAFLHFVTL